MEMCGSLKAATIKLSSTQLSITCDVYTVARLIIIINFCALNYLCIVSEGNKFVQVHIRKAKSDSCFTVCGHFSDFLS